MLTAGAVFELQGQGPAAFCRKSPPLRGSIFDKNLAFSNRIDCQRSMIQKPLISICLMKHEKQNSPSKKQMLQEMASQMSASVRAEVRNLIEELGLTLVSVNGSTFNTAAL